LRKGIISPHPDSLPSREREPIGFIFIPVGEGDQGNDFPDVRPVFSSSVQSALHDKWIKAGSF
jgi:hypothetical protein